MQRILLAQKAFSAFYEYPLIGRYLSGTTASGLFEARLAHEEMGKENHVFCPAFLPQEMDELVEICDHIVFNSVSQYLLHRDKIEKADKKNKCRAQNKPLSAPHRRGMRYMTHVRRARGLG